MADHAVLVYLDGASLPDEVYEEYDLATLEDQLIEVIKTANVGELDGNEFREREVVLFLYGPDAEKLFAAIETVLRAYPLCKGARIEIRPGGPEITGRTLKLS